MNITPPTGFTWFCVRRDGVATRDGWTDETSLADLRSRVGATSDEVVEVCLVDRLRDVDAKKFGGSFYNRVRGILGMEITFRGEIARIAPTQMLAANLSFRRAVERFLVQRSASLDDLVAEGGLRAFSARQFLLPASPDGTAVELFRGCQLVNPNSRGTRLRPPLWQVQSAHGCFETCPPEESCRTSTGRVAERFRPLTMRSVNFWHPWLWHAWGRSEEVLRCVMRLGAICALI